MALTSYCNCDTLETVLNSDAANFHEEMAPELLFFDPSDDGFSVQNTFIDSYLHPSNHFYADIYPYLLPTAFPCGPFMSPCSDSFPLQNLNPFQCLKRQKCIDVDTNNEFVHAEFKPSLNSGRDMDSYEVLSHPLPRLPDFKAPHEANYCNENIVKYEKKIETNFVSGSAQSMAARERRRKIKEKTQELGRLIPGGLKLNTAEMLHAASKYVKYLQAQVGMLEVMDKMKDTEGSAPTEDMKVLLACNLIQEKLYSKTKCIIPREFVASLANHVHVQSKPSLRDKLEELIKLDG